MQELESSFIASNAQTLLKLQSRNSGSLRCNKVDCPEPDMDAGLAPVHHGVGRDRRQVMASTTLQLSWKGRDPKRFARDTTLPTNESVWPTHSIQIPKACRLIWKHALKIQMVSRAFLLLNIGWYFHVFPWRTIARELLYRNRIRREKSRGPESIMERPARPIHARPRRNEAVLLLA